MPKRKASFAFRDDRPAKLVKKTTASTVTSSLIPRPSTRRPVFAPVLLPPSPSKTTEVGPTSPFDDSDPVPSLRRASTLTLPTESPTSPGSSKHLSAERSSKSSKTSSMTKKPSTDSALVTHLSGTKSGSVIGITASTSADKGAKSGSLSRKSSSLKAGPSGIKIPSGLTKLAFPPSKSSLRVSESVLIGTVDESEISSALASLKSTLGKRISSVRSASTPPLSTSSSVASVSRLNSKSLIRSNASVTTLSKSATGVKSNSPQRVPSVSRLSSKPSKELSKASLSRVTSRASDTAKEDSSKVQSPDLEGNVASEEVSDAEPMAGCSGSGVTDKLPPAGLVEVALSFDTTGSMYIYLEEVRAKVQDLIQRLQADIPGIRIAVLAHGDYSDLSTYVVKWIDFTTSVADLCTFVRDVEQTGGGDAEECYELVLQRTREVLSWTPGSQRLLIMISDNVPHKPGYKYLGITYNIDWRHECDQLRNMNVRVYGVHAGNHQAGLKFSQEISQRTGGVHLPISDFNVLFDMIMMICYREGNPDMLEAYAAEIATRPVEARWDVTDIRSKLDDTRMLMLKAPPCKPALTKLIAKKRLAIKTKTNSEDKKKPRKKEKTAKSTAKTDKKVKAKTTKKSTKMAARKGKTKRCLREKINTRSFHTGPLKKLVWSRWLKFVTKKSIHNTSKRGFKLTKSGDCVMVECLFHDQITEPVIYEVAVRSPMNSKMHPMYFSASLGLKQTKFLSSVLLNRADIYAEVEEAAKKNLIVSVRRGVPKAKSRGAKVKTVEEVRKFLDRGFDYAWKTYRSVERKQHRYVKIFRKKSGWDVISHPKYP